TDVVVVDGAAITVVDALGAVVVGAAVVEVDPGAALPPPHAATSTASASVAAVVWALPFKTGGKLARGSRPTKACRTPCGSAPENDDDEPAGRAVDHGHTRAVVLLSERYGPHLLVGEDGVERGEGSAGERHRLGAVQQPHVDPGLGIGDTVGVTGQLTGQIRVGSPQLRELEQDLARG